MANSDKELTARAGCEIRNLSAFVEAICEIKKKVGEVDFPHKKTVLFRGQSSTAYDIIPSLGRERDGICDISIFNEERNLIELAKYRMPDVFRFDLQPVELLALLQHHGIPTRLLDVTENALVALYFSCCGDFEKDGEVFVFQDKEGNVATYPVINAIADSYRFASSTLRPLHSFYADVIRQSYFLEQHRVMEALHKSDDEGGQWIEECCEEPLFIYAPIRSMRQQLQRGRYILFPNRIESLGKGTKAFASCLDPLPKNHKCIVGRIIIPAVYKQQLLSDLEVFGINKASLFADNTDTVCSDIVNICKRRCGKV